MYIHDMIIIGGGPSGYTAALYGARAGLDTLLIERMSAGGQMALTGDIDNYPGFEEGIDGFTLGMKMQQSAERFGAKSQYAEVLDVDLSEKTKVIHTDSGDFYARTVVISTGANPRYLGLEGEEELIGRGVHFCAHCDGRFYKDKTVIVVGGGNSAVSDALLLSRLAKKVYLVHRRDTLRAERIFRDAIFKAENVEFVWNSSVKKLLVNEKLDGVCLKNVQNGEESEIFADALFVSIGRKPATNFLSGKLDLDGAGYIIADESTRTKLPGVFAAGDVRTKPLRQVVTATSDGAVAAHMAEEYLSAHEV